MEYDFYGSNSYSLYQGKDSVASFVLLVWCSSGDPSLLKKARLNWYDSFVKRRKKAWRVLLSKYFGQFCGVEIENFEKEEGTNQKMETFVT